MKDGFIKVAACTPEIQVADVDFNVDKIISQLEKFYWMIREPQRRRRGKRA